MPSIQLTKGYSTEVDEEDVDILNQFVWFAQVDDHGAYAVSHITYPDESTERNVHMHRFLMGCRRGDGKIVDHRDHNTLNNCRSNLRVTDKTGSACNRRKPKIGKGSYKGVRWRADIKKWQSRIQVQGRRKLLGNFTSEVAAARAYDVAAVEIHGEFAVLNFKAKDRSNEQIHTGSTPTEQRELF